MSRPPGDFIHNMKNKCVTNTSLVAILLQLYPNVALTRFIIAYFVVLHKPESNGEYLLKKDC